VRVVGSVEINQPASQVWAYVADYGNDPSWRAAVTQCLTDPPPPSGMGALMVARLLAPTLGQGRRHHRPRPRRAGAHRAACWRQPWPGPPPIIPRTWRPAAVRSDGSARLELGHGLDPSAAKARAHRPRHRLGRLARRRRCLPRPQHRQPDQSGPPDGPGRLSGDGTDRLGRPCPLEPGLPGDRVDLLPRQRLGPVPPLLGPVQARDQPRRHHRLAALHADPRAPRRHRRSDGRVRY
jgi:hypothetical protein